MKTLKANFKWDKTPLFLLFLSVLTWHVDPSPPLIKHKTAFRFRVAAHHLAEGLYVDLSCNLSPVWIYLFTLKRRVMCDGREEDSFLCFASIFCVILARVLLCRGAETSCSDSAASHQSAKEHWWLQGAQAVTNTFVRSVQVSGNKTPSHHNNLSITHKSDSSLPSPPPPSHHNIHVVGGNQIHLSSGFCSFVK